MDTKNRLYRSSADKMIAGVSAGLAEYFNIDPVLVRIIFIVLLISGGSGLLIYVILWIVVPYDYEIGVKPIFHESASNAETDNSESNKNREQSAFNNIEDNDNYQVKNNHKKLAGIILIVIGALLLADNFFLTDFIFDNLVPILLILAGLFIVFYRKKTKQQVNI